MAKALVTLGIFAILMVDIGVVCSKKPSKAIVKKALLGGAI